MSATTASPAALSHSKSKLALFIWFLSAVFYLYECVLQVSPSVMVQDLMQSFHVNGTQLGNLAAFYFYSYAVMQIPVGVLVDNYNVRWLLTIASGACFLGCLIFSKATVLFHAEIGRLLIGFGSAFAVVSTMKLAANWFNAKHFPLLVGCMVSMGMLGSMIGEKPLALMVAGLGFRPTMMFLALMGLVLTALIFTFVRHSPKKADQTLSFKNAEHNMDNTPLLAGLKIVLTCRQSWLLAAYGGLMFASTSIFGALWGVPFIEQAYGLSRPEAAGIVSYLFLGWMLGAPITGLICELAKTEKTVMTIGAIGAGSAIALIIYCPIFPLWTLSLLMVLFGFFSSFFLPAFSLMRELHSNDYAGAALGFMNMANMIGGALGQPFIGYLLDMTQTASVANGHVYATAGYQMALTALPLMFLLSLVLIPMICIDTLKGNK